MRALIYEGTDSLAVRDRPTPTAGPGDALVRVRYIGICGSDLHVWQGHMSAVEPPVIMGHEIVGEVVQGTTPGQRVAIEPLASCGACRACREGHAHVCRQLKVLGVHADGGGAELMRIPERRLHPVPDSLSWEAAACTEPTAVAVHMVRRAAIQVGDSVLVLGGGPIGFLVACVARAAGAGRVVISEVSPYRLDFCRRAGFQTIDARAQDPVATIRDLTDGEGADVVVEAVGHASTAAIMTAAVRVRGTILLGGMPPEPAPVDLRVVAQRELHLVGSRVYESRDVDTAIDLLATGRVDVSALVTRIVPLGRAIDDGFERLRHSREEMKILISIQD